MFRAVMGSAIQRHHEALNTALKNRSEHAGGHGVLAVEDGAVGLMMSLNMLIEFGDAFDYTGSDFTGWCREAGFREVEIVPLTGPASAGIAYK